jgi:nucleotide-binding universal stress UspA family protein
VPTLIANAFFLPHHLVSKSEATPAETAINARAIGSVSKQVIHSAHCSTTVVR